eukprot:2297825-Ditylum_brightwellii.AAC.1
MYEEATDADPITWKFRKKEVKNAGKSAQALTQFLSNSAATGKKYTDIDNCWKRKPKLDYLAIEGDKEKKQKQDWKKSAVQKERSDKDHHD